LRRYSEELSRQADVISSAYARELNDMRGRMDAAEREAAAATAQLEPVSTAAAAARTAEAEAAAQLKARAYTRPAPIST
jgi:hypothetical protein